MSMAWSCEGDGPLVEVDNSHDAFLGRYGQDFWFDDFIHRQMLIAYALFFTMAILLSFIIHPFHLKI